MPEPHWPDVLTALYEGEFGVAMTAGEFETNEILGFLKIETGLEEPEIVDSIDFLREMELIEGFYLDPPEGEKQVVGGITSKGFEVAHERELNENQVRINRSLVVFTFALVAVGIVGVLPTEYQLAGAGIVLLGVGYWVKRAELA